MKFEFKTFHAHFRNDSVRRRKVFSSALLYLLRKGLGRLTYNSNFGKRPVASYSTDVRKYLK